ncbi:MAG: hypothetical protein V3U16_07915 [Candidatus Neomarinimicrobiota bacterium]
MKWKYIFSILTITVMMNTLSADNNQKNLTTDGQRVVDYLLSDWKKRFHSTTIHQAMANLNIKPDDLLRLSVGQYIRDNPGIARNIRFWSANNYILSDQEKRIIKYLIFTGEKTDLTPSLRVMSKDLVINENNLQDRLSFLAKTGILIKDSDRPLGYSLVNNYSNWGGPLRYNFHTVTVDDANPFGVW